MFIATVVTLVASILIGRYFGKIANTMSGPGKTFRQFGVVGSAIAGVVVAIFVVVGGGSALSFIFLPLLGGGAAACVVVFIKSRR